MAITIPPTIFRGVLKRVCFLLVRGFKRAYVKPKFLM